MNSATVYLELDGPWNTSCGLKSAKVVCASVPVPLILLQAEAEHHPQGLQGLLTVQAACMLACSSFVSTARISIYKCRLNQANKVVKAIS
jgi:hypothetical protein